MNLADTNLAELLNRLSPRERRLLSDALGEAGQLSADVREILRWLKRRLKRRAQSKRR